MPSAIDTKPETKPETKSQPGQAAETAAPPWRMPAVPIGCPVQWLHSASSQDSPTAATVVNVQPGVSVVLHVEPHRDRPRELSGVRHIDDPSLITATPESRAARGAWRFIPGLEPQDAGKPDRDLSNEERVVVALYGEGLTAVQIAQRVQGAFANFQKVNAFLRRRNLIQ